MKKFEITFTSGDGIFSVNIVYAKSDEQAAGYYTALGHTVIACSETTRTPKPGQPVTDVPEDWEPDQEQKN